MSAGNATPRDAFWIIRNTDEADGTTAMVRLDGEELMRIGWFVRRRDAERVQRCVHACGDFENPETAIRDMKAQLLYMKERESTLDWRLRVAGVMAGIAFVVTVANLLIYFLSPS